ncbi:class I SAM-dependent RNA methyltransferase [Frankia sp. CNm7]|uniref:Class I SAM-dependent RNA methyltransferase n=1 Tax=Frankia nepalensis TaxID=1836974 RepID=A0A937RJA5_9ACTN|nr:TRAM domain-containing protein [Frankia nepalensis]MBL7499344.1 class I SAM-dependent RNA methyltransferase [Frankia nepalensis]MBL7515208.1 class I SAM-dependent RNA methyltransferase [Frankia nepalensis]MBL7524005.1 class I SAM-dependent RNA methyltransferase [Frankia nepalensis]MBL7629884.1 class I SAM-dependent RNA methyltransferase [Frankia nepalensis]
MPVDPPPPASLPTEGELVELTVGQVAHGGSCVARADGRVVFVRHALPGERVRARVTDRSHDRYWRADAVEILEASPDRVAPPCPHAGPGLCGGCDWQHASPPAQRRLKAQVVVDALRRQGGLPARVAADDAPYGGAPRDDAAYDAARDDKDAPGLAVSVEPLPGVGGDDGLGWRTRMRFAVTDAGEVGLRAYRSHRVVATPDCRIAHPLVAGAVAGRRFPGAEAVEVAASVRSGRVSVRPDGGQDVADGHAGASEEGPLVERVHGRQFQVDAAAFWQVHPAAARTLVDAVLAALAPRAGDRALDLYAGAGLFAAFLAEAVGPDGEVIAIESDAAAVASAARSLADLPWVSVRPVRVTARTVRGCVGSAGGVDVAVLDPPRTGAGPDVLAALLALRPRAVAYVACDPVALARDLAVAEGAGYLVDEVRGFDLFPMTAHVECVARLVPAGS